MNNPARKLSFTLSTMAAALLLSGWPIISHADDFSVTLSGTNESPPVKTSASGSGRIMVTPGKKISGSVTTSGVAATMAHIHSGAAGQNGPVVIPLNRIGDNVWSVPEGTLLPDAAYKDFEAGKLYVNVHSEAHPAGEIRGQLEAPPWVKDESKAVRSTAGGGY